MTGRALRWAVRSYLRWVGAYIDKHDCVWPNTTAGDDEQ